jgi:hypothetical protein
MVATACSTVPDSSSAAGSSHPPRSPAENAARIAHLMMFTGIVDSLLFEQAWLERARGFVRASFMVNDSTVTDLPSAALA